MIFLSVFSYFYIFPFKSGYFYICKSKPNKSIQGILDKALNYDGFSLLCKKLNERFNHFEITLLHQF